MEVIEYDENGLPKGYLARRKAGLLYIISVYIYCAVNLLLEYRILVVPGNIHTLLNGLLIIMSCGFLIFSQIAKREYKGLEIHKHNEINAFSVREKWLFALPIIVFCILIPLRMLSYSFFAGVVYLSAKSYNRYPTSGERGRFI